MRGAELLAIDPAVVAAWTAGWGCPALERRVEVVIGERLHRSLARCDLRRRRIRVHPLLVGQARALREEVLCHELAHLAVAALHGVGPRPHGPEWRALMAQAGFTPRTRIALELPVEAAPSPLRGKRLRYRHHCGVCGATRFAARRMSRWRCRGCVEQGRRGLLEIEPLD